MFCGLLITVVEVRWGCVLSGQWLLRCCMLSMAASVLKRGLGHEKSVHCLVKWLLQRSAVLIPSLTCISTILEEEVHLFQYFEIVDKYYYVLVEVSSSSSRQCWDPDSMKSQHRDFYIFRFLNRNNRSVEKNSRWMINTVVLHGGAVLTSGRLWNRLI